MVCGKVSSGAMWQASTIMMIYQMLNGNGAGNPRMKSILDLMEHAFEKVKGSSGAAVAQSDD